MRRPGHGVVLALLAGATACEPEPDQTEPRDPESLIEGLQWQRSDLADDPLADHQPATVECSDEAAYPEALGFEIETTDCNYLSVEQPSLVDVAPGDVMEVVFLYYDLAAAEPAQTHAAVLIDGQIAWEAEIPIPSPSGVLREMVELSMEASRGAPVTFHLHNHGYNTYNLVDVTVAR